MLTLLQSRPQQHDHSRFACNIHHCRHHHCYCALYTGVDRQLAQGQGIWGLFQLPSSQGRPEDLYSHPVSESLEFSVVATSTSRQHSLSLTFRSAWHTLCTANRTKALPIAVYAHGGIHTTQAWRIHFTTCLHSNQPKRCLGCSIVLDMRQTRLY